jgi:hypothetical protein
MVSKKNNRRRNSRRKSTCNGGRRRKSNASRTEKKHNKWHQKGCQSGGGGFTGGWAWAPSSVHPQTAGTNCIPQSINGNHYALNTATMTPPQSSNHLVERGQFGGTKKYRKRRSRLVREQRGGMQMAKYLPDAANTTLRSIAQIPTFAMNGLQGGSTVPSQADPTIQPIGQSHQR